MIKELRKLCLEEVEAYHKSVFQIPINKFDVIKEILSIVRIMSYSEADKQKLRTQIKVLYKASIDGKKDLVKIN
ncbi:MAG: hypothetical protein QW260_07485 [Thermoproteota archaeon]